MQQKRYLQLQPSEATVVRAAADIYAAYVTAGRVAEGQEAQYLRKAIKEAILIAETVDAEIQSDNEVQ